MPRTLVLGILVLALAVVGERVSSRVAATDQTAASKELVLQFFKEPQALPGFTLRTLDGRTLRGEDLRGKVTIVNFWATWCPPCRAEIPDLVALQKKYPNHLQIIGISEDVGSSQIVRQFIAEHRINYPIAMATPEVERVFSGVTGLPTTFILDPACSVSLPLARRIAEEIAKKPIPDDGRDD